MTRPRGIPEWVWAIVGAALLAACGLVPLRDVGAAIGRGTDVYLFLAGMLLLAELARREGVFDWIASHAANAARGSRLRLFVLVYGVGVGVTTVLSNDATAVVLTPAVAAAVKKAKVSPLPHLLACAFIANAASFVLPISNPANLVVFGGAMPALPRWVLTFAIPSLIAIVMTFVVLAFISRHDLRGRITATVDVADLRRGGRMALAGIGLTAIALLIASALGAPLGATTCGCGGVIFALACARDARAFGAVLRSVSWTVLLLVAGLFVLVQGLDATGLLALGRRGAEVLAAWPPALGALGAGAVSAVASNALNNLPSALIAGTSVATLHDHAALRAAVAVGIDLGPNLSVTGSLATVLWLIALRREGIEVTGAQFLRVGALVMPPALIPAVLSILLTTR